MLGGFLMMLALRGLLGTPAAQGPEDWLSSCLRSPVILKRLKMGATGMGGGGWEHSPIVDSEPELLILIIAFSFTTRGLLCVP